MVFVQKYQILGADKYEKIAMMQMIEKWEANEERTAQKQYGDVYAEVRLGERIW